jgi:GT2 family glycosyltransferase/glycosyltransferase involved in cell wall biosynthesis
MGHVPFGMYLVDVLRPRAIAELGTANGVSYCAFCQAVKELDLPAQCYAIDTWQGDGQSGLSGPEVLNDLRQHHSLLYRDFSTLIQSTFDEALHHFKAHSFDLLHFFHSHEAIKQDFRKWLPALTDRGIVLLHDIGVQDGEFGMGSFWEEIKSEYPHFEFLHGRGLGVLAVGRNYPDELNQLFQCSAEEAIKIRHLFAYLGARLEAANKLQFAEMTASELANVQHEKKAKEQQLDAQSQELQEQQKQLRIIGQQLEDHQQQLQVRQTQLQDRDEQLQEVRRQLSLKDQELEQRLHIIEVTDPELRKLELQVQQYEQTLLEKDQEIEEISRQAEERQSLWESKDRRKYEEQLRSRDQIVQKLNHELLQTKTQRSEETTRHSRDSRWLTEQNRALRSQVERAEGKVVVLSAQLLDTETRLKRITDTLGWRLLSEYGKFKYKFLLPVYRLLGQASTERMETESAHDHSESRIGIEVSTAPGLADGLEQPAPDPIDQYISSRGNAADMIPFSIGTSAVPVISIVIPVFNQSRYTFNCLSSIRDVMEDSKLKVEIIIVDDKSSDDTQEVLSQISGIRVVTNEENLGFIDSCNRGAAIARGQYLLFLNNDTLVSPRFLEELLGTFEIKADAGLVGAKLLYPDGRLQEAGGIIWNDASGWNFGHSDDPEKPEYCYLRKVDYCSGACIMVPRHLFNRLGGFDTRYRPAYYEDADLSFQIRKAGYGVYYQPLARVTHFEGITSGTDVSTSVKSYQVVNQKIFREKWKTVLAGHGTPGVEAYAAKERPVAKRILVLDACVLTPDQDAGSLMVYSQLKVFQSLGYKVTFVAHDLQRDEKYTTNLQRIGIECLYAPQVPSIKSHLERYGDYYDFVFMNRVVVAQSHCEDIRAHCRRAKILFNTIDLHFVREQRQAEIQNDPLLADSALKLKELELGIAEKADCTLVVSPYEEKVLSKENPALNVRVVPMGHDMPGRQADLPGRSDILFIGGFQHLPNVDAVLYFVEKILPLIKLRIPEIKFYVVGSKPPAEILDLATDPSIIVTGYVEDVATYFNRCRLSIAPLRYGAGMKGKVIVSLSYGLPIVASTLACEGIGLENEVNALIADDPSEFSEKVLRLCEDDALWNRLSLAGFEKVNRDYSEAPMRLFFERLFTSLDERGSQEPAGHLIPALKA